MIPEVDVVVLSWGRREDTLDALQSVLSQERVEPRLWVVDQGSPPEQVADLRALAASHPKVHLMELGRNIGVPGGRNAGIRRGEAEWVVCMDNDAVLASPDALARVAERFRSSPRLGAVAFRSEDYRSGAVDRTAWAYPVSLMHVDRPVMVTRFVGVGHGLRREAFEAVGGYDDRLFFCEEELDLSCKLIGRGYHIVYDPGIVVRHKVSREARVSWDDARVYYQTRNAVLVDHRHHRSTTRTLATAAGWVTRAAFNRRVGPALRGIRDAARMWRGDREQYLPLGPEARRYIEAHDTRLRGSWLRRLRREVLAGLPVAYTDEGRP